MKNWKYKLFLFLTAPAQAYQAFWAWVLDQHYYCEEMPPEDEE